MSFFRSQLLKNLEQGELPTVKTDSKVTIDQNSIVKLGVVVIVVAAGITLLIVAIRSMK